MSRVGKKPIPVPDGVHVAIDGQRINVKGKKGTAELQVHPLVVVQQENGELIVVPSRVSTEAKYRAMTGTMRSLINNMVIGVSQGFERKLQLVGVGYRAQTQGEVLNLTIGFSHPVNFKIPEGVTIETPSPTEIVVRGVDKQLVGEVSAKIRAYRPPEPYKGKGVRYSDETIILKEAKKK
ncbi:MAG: 50S ribosomal protein L6 [Candidatus Contendobacter odensis]|uniref:Large ribosomal subunit protein uL6 n=1 Tax=Candidatus Contendibacter odensensis TaxID=1400860 RepID=A0A2G6PFD4_9GAMM|nr:MAG: 50S ribosomal protein L6 [Candidatus Contendobacter odensis]